MKDEEEETRKRRRVGRKKKICSHKECEWVLDLWPDGANEGDLIDVDPNHLNHIANFLHESVVFRIGNAPPVVGLVDVMKTLQHWFQARAVLQMVHQPEEVWLVDGQGDYEGAKKIIIKGRTIFHQRPEESSEASFMGTTTTTTNSSSSSSNPLSPSPNFGMTASGNEGIPSLPAFPCTTDPIPFVVILAMASLDPPKIKEYTIYADPSPTTASPSPSPGPSYSYSPSPSPC